MAKSYVLLDLVSINVTTKKTNNDTIVFCDSITVKKREDQSFESINDWANIIIGNSKYNVDDEQTVNVSTIDTNSGAVTLEENIGLWSVILFKTITDKDDTYTKLNDVISGSSGVGGSGTGETGVEEVYFDNNITEYAKNTDLVNDFLNDVLGNTFNGCIFIDNSNCGIFLNISPLMFNEQTNLEKISLTNTIVYIGETNSVAGVFSNCNNLVNANIPEYLGCYNIIETKQDGTTSTKNNTTRTVPGYYFHDCKLLESIIIPDGITQIGFSAFYGCDSVETINIPSSVLTIYSNSLLTVNREETRYINVNGDVDDKNDITFFSKSVGYNKPSNNNTPYCQNTVIISINNRGIVNLYGSISLNDTSFITNVKNDSKIYIDCEKINGVSIGNTTNSSTKFYYGGFIGTTFKTIYIGPSVKEICNFAFYNVTSEIIIDNNHILNKEYTDNTETGSLESNKYQDGTYLIKTPFAKSKFNNIDILNCETIGKYALHSLNSNNLTFYKEGYTTKLKDDLKITNNILLTTLSDYAFYNSSFGEITIPSSVNSISNTSFLQTKGSLILNCNISTYETTINQNERKHTGILVNSEFSKITFDYDGSIPANVLYENKSINSIELGDNISRIYAKAFYLCTNLSNTLTIPSKLSDISTDAFIGCIFSKFESASEEQYYQTDDSGMYLLTDNKTSIVLFANKHTGIQIVDNTFNINIDGVTGIGDYAFAYAFSDYVNSNVYAVTISKNIKRFGGNVFYNCHKLTRITFYPDNIAEFEDLSTSPNNIEVNGVSLTGVSIYGSFSDLPLLKEVYIGYATGVLLSDSIPNNDEERNNFLYNTIRNSYTNNESDISKITIYVYEELVETYEGSAWKLAGYKISGISKGVPPQPPVPPVENDDSYDADIDDPEGEEWPWDGGNGNISDEEDYIPPIDVSNTTTEENDDNWIKPNENNNGFIVPIKQLGIPSINIYGCRLDLLNPTYYDDKVPANSVVIDDSGNINQEALDNLIFNKVSNETKNGWSSDDNLFKLYLGDAGNNFLIIFTATGIDNFDATTKIFTSGVEYPINKESNWLNTTIVRIVEARHHNSEIETLDVEGETSNDIGEKIYYVVLLCTCLKLQTKDNYNCRTAIVSVNYGSQMLDSSTNTDEQITTKIKILQHKTELRLSNNTREINITDLPVLFCKQTERTEFTGNFFIGFPKNFWSIGTTIDTDGTSTNKNKLREYINDYFRILYDKEKIKVIGQKTKIGELDYTYIFDVADDKYANIKEPGSTNNKLMTFNTCIKTYGEDKLSEIHEEYYYVNFKIENIKTTLAGGVWNISIYNIGEPAEMLHIQVIENKTDIPSIVLFDENVSVYGKQFTGEDVEEDTHELRNDVCYSIYNTAYVALNYFIPIAITNLPIVSNKIIYPEAEVVDLCVDSSCIIDCGNAGNTLFGTGGGDLFNNYRGVLTLNPNSTTHLVFPISSSKLKHTALSSIKYTCSNTQNAGLYAYFGNEDDPVTKCSCTKNITKIKYTGSKGDSDILENTTTFLYDFNTGVSCINQTTGGVSELLYNNFLSINNNDNNTLEVKNINTSNSDIAYHDENYVKENNLCFSSLKFVYDKFYNVLAPLYPYSEYTTKYKTDYSDSSQILVNQYYDATYTQLVGNSTTVIYKNTLYTYIENESEQIATGSTYYCTSTPGIIITAEEGNLTDDKFNVYTGQAYLVTDDSSNKITIGVNTVTDTLNYTMESINNKYNNTDIYSTASTVTLLPLYKISTDELTVSAHSEINSDDLKTRYSNELTHGLVVNVIGTANISFTPNNKSDSIVYEDKKDNKYYDINNNEFDKTTLYTCSVEVTRYDKYVYISDSTVSSFTIPNIGATYNYTDVFGDNSTITLNAFNILSSTVDVPANKIFEYGDPIYDNNGNINTTPEITATQYKTNSLNIGNALLSDYDKSVDQTRFRQVFLNFYYSILDNGVKTKVYADNTDGILMHLRLINNYNKPVETLPVFTVTNMNIFNFSFNSTINNNIFNGSQVMTPVYPTIKL